MLFENYFANVWDELKLMTQYVLVMAVAGIGQKEESHGFSLAFAYI